VPGVVAHGLFIGLTHMAIIGGPDGVKVVEQS
jgi:ribose 5-phosphate isomerase